ncbi:MAG: hypothetical protein Q9227_005725 [Pyrenula ochraceoflavens]
MTDSTADSSTDNNESITTGATSGCEQPDSSAKEANVDADAGIDADQDPAEQPTSPPKGTDADAAIDTDQDPAEQPTSPPKGADADAAIDTAHEPSEQSHPEDSRTDDQPLKTAPSGDNENGSIPPKGPKSADSEPDSPLQERITSVNHETDKSSSRQSPLVPSSSGESPGSQNARTPLPPPVPKPPVHRPAAPPAAPPAATPPSHTSMADSTKDCSTNNSEYAGSDDAKSSTADVDDASSSSQRSRKPGELWNPTLDRYAPPPYPVPSFLKQSGPHILIRYQILCHSCPKPIMVDGSKSLKVLVCNKFSRELEHTQNEDGHFLCKRPHFVTENGVKKLMNSKEGLEVIKQTVKGSKEWCKMCRPKVKRAKNPKAEEAEKKKALALKEAKNSKAAEAENKKAKNSKATKAEKKKNKAFEEALARARR